MNLWMLQCSPQVWDIFSWWSDGDGDFDSWTVSRHLDEIDAGDRFVLWVGGDNSGVYAFGTVTGPACPTQMSADPLDFTGLTRLAVDWGPVVTP